MSWPLATSSLPWARSSLRRPRGLELLLPHAHAKKPPSDVAISLAWHRDGGRADGTDEELGRADVRSAHALSSRGGLDFCLFWC
eukprot:scaffold7039_cov255-Pinguiococcus_pyrenoidosus.AAC.3